MNTYQKSMNAISALTKEQYRVTQENGTERPGTGELLKNTKPGIYVDIVSGEPLFASSAKYESGCGWPSFTKAIDSVNVIEITDRSHGMTRNIRPRGDISTYKARWCLALFFQNIKHIQEIRGSNEKNIGTALYNTFYTTTSSKCK